MDGIIIAVLAVNVIIAAVIAAGEPPIDYDEQED